MTPPLPSVWTTLLREPARFCFDAALRVLMQRARTADPAKAARFSTPPGLGYPAAEVAAVQVSEAGRPRLTTALIGLVGPAGTLPRLYGEITTAMLRARSTALPDFLDLLAQRFVAFFARAGIKYRLHRADENAAFVGLQQPDVVRQALLALTGHATPGMAGRVAAGSDALLHYAGLFAMRPRSAERLAALVADWLGEAVEVQQFAGAWLVLPQDQRTSLPLGRSAGTWNRLGVDAAIGVRSWDAQVGIVLRIGPLGHAAFNALLPDRPGHAQLKSLVAAFLEAETACAINPVLRGEEVPALQLTLERQMAPLLGWNTWLEPTAGTRLVPRRDAADAVFPADSVG